MHNPGGSIVWNLPPVAADWMEEANLNKHLDKHPAGSPETWLDEHGSALYRYALLHLRDPHKAEDAVQETLLAALTAHGRFAGGASVRTWLVGILKHKVMDQFRRQVREVQLEDPDDCAESDAPGDESDFAPSGHWRNRLSDWGNPEKTLERCEFIAFLQCCLDALPQRLAHLFWLREVLEEDTKTICKDLAITPNNLWTMLHRARLGLRRCLDSTWLKDAAHRG